MSVMLTLTVVTKAVPTLLGHSHVAVAVATLCPAMEELVLRTTSVLLEHTTVSRDVSTLGADSVVNVSLAFNSIQIKVPALVSES